MATPNNIVVMLGLKLRSSPTRKNRTKKQAFEQRFDFLVVMVEEYNVNSH